MQRGQIKIWARILATIAILGLILMPTSFALATSLDDLYQERDNLSESAKRQREEAEQKKQEAQRLGSEVSNLEAQIADTEVKIGDTQGQINQVNVEIELKRKEIEIKEIELKVENEKLNQALIEIYRSTSRSAWEIILATGTLSDAADQTKYLENLENQIENTINEINRIKQDLEQKKSSLEDKAAQLRQLREQQEMLRRATAAQRNQKEKLQQGALQSAEEAIAAARDAERRIGSIDTAIRRALEESGGSSSGHLTGQDVSTGTVLGYMGSTGNSTGPHLHLEVRYSGGYGGDGNIYDFLNVGYYNTSNPVNNCSIGMDGNGLAYNFGLGKPLNNPRIVTACWGSGGYGDDGWHGGIDMVEYQGAPVLAARGGKVVFHGNLGAWGNAAVIYHGGGLWTLYGHML